MAPDLGNPGNLVPSICPQYLAQENVLQSAQEEQLSVEEPRSDGNSGRGMKA